jgi:hypothetical protein
MKVGLRFDINKEVIDWELKVKGKMKGIPFED